MKNLRHLALLCALVPAALVSGCGGGSGVAPSGPQLPTDIPSTALPATAFRLASGQIALLNLSRLDNSVGGSLRIVGDATVGPGIAAGSYPLAGDFSAPNGFSLASPRGSAGNLSLSGTLPSRVADGSYNFTAGNVSQSGVLSAQGIIGTPRSYAATGDLRFSDFSARGPLKQLSDYPFDLVPVTPSGADAFNTLSSLPQNDGVIQYNSRNGTLSHYLSVRGARTDNANSRRNARIFVQIDPILAANPVLLSAGQTFDLNKPPVAGATYGATVGVTLGGFDYLSSAGMLTIKSLSAEAVSFELRDVIVGNSSSFPGNSAIGFPNDGQPISRFTVNGTFAASGVTTVVINQPS